MRLWDGHKLVRSFSTESRELRKDFLAYILCCNGNTATLPLRVASWIFHLSERKNGITTKCRQRVDSYGTMDSKLEKALMEKTVTAFQSLVDAEAGWPSSKANSSVGNGISIGIDIAANKGAPDATAPTVSSVAIDIAPAHQNQEATTDEVGVVAHTVSQAQAQPTSGPDQNSRLPPLLLRSVLLRGLTSTGDGVLHIAARHGREDLVRAIFNKAGVHLEEPEAAAGAREREQRPVTSLGRQREASMCGFTCRCCLPFPCKEEDAKQEEREGEGDERRPPVPSPAVVTCAEEEAEQGPRLRFAEFLRTRNQMGETCLHEAIRFGSMSLVHLLIAVDASLNDATSPALVQILDQDGTSPLYLATTLRRLEIIKALTDKDYKYSVSYAGPDGKTALHAAVLLSTELCELLLSWNKSLAKSTDNLGRTPLHYLGRRDTAIANLILNQDDAPSCGYCPDSEGWLPIHVAASRGRLDIVTTLVEKCPDCISSRNTSGQTFLHIAVDKGHSSIVGYVCREPKLTAVLNMRDTNGDTALHLAVEKGDEFIFWRLLGNKNVCLSFINRQGKTPLDLAVMAINTAPKYKYKWEWIRDDLVDCRADFSAYRWDDLKVSEFRCWDKDYHTINLISKILGKWPIVVLRILRDWTILILKIQCDVPINFVRKIKLDDLINLVRMDCIRKILWDFPISFISKFLWDDPVKLIHDIGDRIFNSNIISERDDEKESERLGKSAAALAAGALILTISFQTPFNAVDKKRLSSELAEDKRTQTFTRLVAVDSISMAASVLSIFFCTIAGYPTGRFWIRSYALFLGGMLLCAAAVAILLVFALGLSLVYDYPRWWISVLAYSMIPIFALLFSFITKSGTGSPWQVLACVWARYRRTGLLSVGLLLLQKGFIQFLLIYVLVVPLLTNICAPFLINYLAPNQ